MENPLLGERGVNCPAERAERGVAENYTQREQMLAKTDQGVTESDRVHTDRVATDNSVKSSCKLMFSSSASSSESNSLSLSLSSLGSASSVWSVVASTSGVASLCSSSSSSPASLNRTSAASPVDACLQIAIQLRHTRKRREKLTIPTIYSVWATV